MKQGLVFLAAAASCVAASAGTPVTDVELAYAELMPGANAACAGRSISVVVPATLQVHDGAPAGKRRWTYPMRHNQITEGWNWHPESARRGGDYYEYSYLTLSSRDEWRADYVSEDKVGEPQNFRVHWRYDYFLGIANAPRFAADNDDDDAGYEFDLPASVDAAQMQLIATLRISGPCTAESTTFWKATHAHPEDFTLKKRYLLGRLERLELTGAAGTFVASLR